MTRKRVNEYKFSLIKEKKERKGERNAVAGSIALSM